MQNNLRFTLNSPAYSTVIQFALSSIGLFYGHSMKDLCSRITFSTIKVVVGKINHLGTIRLQQGDSLAQHYIPKNLLRRTGEPTQASFCGKTENCNRELKREHNFVLFFFRSYMTLDTGPCCISFPQYSFYGYLQ